MIFGVGMHIVPTLYCFDECCFDELLLLITGLLIPDSDRLLPLGSSTRRSCLIA